MIVDSACGAGVGLVRLAQHFPACRVVGVDGDAYSIEQATARVPGVAAPSRRGVDNAEHASCPSATLPLRGAKPGTGAVKAVPE